MPAAQQSPEPAGAVKYHELLRKRPQAGTMFDRFVDSWLAEGTRDTLRAFLKAKASASGATAADHQLLALFLSRHGEDEAAVAELDEALKTDSTNADAWLEKAKAQTRLLDFEKALTSLESAAKSVKGENQRVEIARLQGRTLLRLGRQEDALKVWQTLTTAHPEDLDLAEEVIELMADEGLYAEAAEAARALVGKTKPGPDLMTRRLRLGDLLLRSDKRDEALTVFESVLEQSGQDSWVEADVLARLAQPFRREDDIEGLKKRLEALHAANPLRPAVTMELAETLTDLGEKEAAVKLVAALLERTPGRRDLQERFVATLERMERYEEAAKQMQRLVEKNGQDKELLVRLATLQEKLKDTQTAQATLASYLKMAAGKDASAPEHDHLRVARLYESWELRTEAGAAYLGMVAAHPDSVSAKEALAHFHHRGEAHALALAIWKELIKTGGLEDVLRIGQALQSHGRLQEGLDVLLTRKDDFADQPRFLALLSQFAAALKDTTRAMEWARQRLKHVKDPAAVQEAVRMAQITIEAAEAGDKVVEELQKQAETISIPDRCLLAALLEAAGRAEEADKALQLVSAAPADLLMLGAQRAKLFETRQEWARAAGVIADLMRIPGGQTSEQAQRLVSMHRRALETEKALAVIPEWKKLSPGAVQPWMEEAALQLERGSESASLDVLRQAARKFAEDTRLLTALAEALARSGHTDEARQVYVSLYEQTEDVQTRLRLLAPLAEMSRLEGRLDSLLEEFQTRQRQNRGSAAPWMALAEIHRAVGNEEERRRCLYEASRMRPKDLALLTEIARCEEESGLTKEALRTLQSATLLDKTQATKQSIARLMIESGDDEAGYRMLLELAGGAGADARALEKMADTMCEHDDWERAIRFLEPLLAQFPDDYRLRYLRATALEQEGRDQEAADAFIELLGFHAEMPEVSAAQTMQAQQGNAMLLGIGGAMGTQLPDGAAEWLAIPGVANLSYEHRMKQRNQMSGWGYMSSRLPAASTTLPTGWVTQPQSVTALSTMALYHLIEIGQGMTDTDKQALAARMTATGMRDAALLFEVPIYQGMLGIPVELLEKHPSHAALHAVWLVSNAYRQVQDEDSIAVLRRCVSLFKDSKPTLVWLAAARALLLGTPEGLEVGKQALTYAEGVTTPDSMALTALYSLLGAATQTEDIGATAKVELPANVLDRLFTLGVRWNEISYQSRASIGYWSGHPFLSALASAGRWEQLAQEIERERVRAMEQEKKLAGRLPYSSPVSFGMGGRLQPQPMQPSWTGLDAPPFIAQTMLGLSRSNQSYGIVYGNMPPAEKADDEAVRKGLQQTLAALKTPALALLMRLRLGEHAEAEKALAVMLGAKDLRADHWLFAAWVAQQAKNWPLVVERLQKAASFGKPADYDNAILYAAQQADADSRLKMRETLQAVFARHDKPNMSPDEAAMLQGVMQAVGFTKEAVELQARQQARQKRQASPGVLAAVNPYSRNAQSSSSGRSLSVQASKLLANGQSEPAYAEVLRSLRPLARQMLDMQQWSNARYEIRNLIEELERKGAAAGFGKWIATRQSAGWRETMEDAALLEVFGKKDEARARYEAAIAQQPRAWQARTRAASLLAESDPAAAASRLAGIPVVELSRFIQRLSQEAGRSDEGTSFEHRLAQIRLMTCWLEAQPAEKRRMDPMLAQVLMNLPQAFQQQEYRDPIRFPALWSTTEQGPKLSDKAIEAQKQLREAHDAFCIAMTRLPMLAEGGYGPLAGLALRDKQPLDKLEQLARDILGNKGWAQRSTAAMRYWGGYSRSRFAAENTISMPHPEDVLILAAARRGQFDLIQSEIIPLIEQAKGRTAARQAQAYAELFRAGSDTFTAAASAWLKSMQPQVDAGSGGEIVRIWSERKLSAPIHDFFLERVKDNQNNYSKVQEISGYVRTLENAGNIKEATSFLRRVRDLWLGDTPEKRDEVIQAYIKERKAQRGRGGFYMSGNNASQRFYPYQQLHQTLTQSNNASLAGIPVLLEDGLLDEEGIRQNIGYSLLSENTIHATEKLLVVLDAMHMLDDAPTFRAWFADQEDNTTMLCRLLDELDNTNAKDAHTRLTQALQARKPATFGTDVILTLLKLDNSERGAALTAFIGSHKAALAKLSPQARLEVHATFHRKVNEYPDYLGEAQKKAIAPLLEAEAATLVKLGDEILAAKQWEDLDLEEYHAQRKIPPLLSLVARQDHAKAAQILEKTVTLLKGTQNYAQNAANGGGSVTSLLSEMGVAPQLMNETRAIVESENIMSQWLQQYGYSLTNSDRLRDTAHVLALFTGTPFVAEAEDFRCLAHSDTSALNRVAESLRSSSYKAAHDALEKELKQRQPQTFGVRTTLLLMAGSNFKGDDYLRESRADFAKMKPDEAEALLSTLERRSSKYRKPDDLPADLREALQPLLTAREKTHEALAQRVLDAPSLQKAEISTSDTSKLAIALGSLAKRNPELAERFFEKVTLLYMGESRRQNGSSPESTPIAWWLRECAGIAPFFTRTLKRAETEGLLTNSNWVNSATSEVSNNNRLRDPTYATTMLRGSVLLADEKLFNALPVVGRFEGSLFGIVLREVRNDKKAKPAVQTMLKAEKPVFGVQLMQALLEDEPDQALRQFFTQNSTLMASLERGPLSSLATVLEREFHPLPVKAKDVPALAPVVAFSRKRALELADELLATRDYDALNRLFNDSDAHTRVTSLITTYDPARGLEVATHVLKLLDAYDQRNTYSRPEHTYGARFLSQVKSAPALLPFVSTEAVKRKLHLNEQWRREAQGSFVLNGRSKDGPFLIDFFESSGLFGKAETYNALPGLGGSQSACALEEIARSCWRDAIHADSRKILIDHIDAQKTRLFGMDLIRCVMDPDGDEAVKRFVTSHGEDLLKLPKDTLPFIASTLAMRTDEHIGYPPSLRDLIHQKATSFHDMVMAGNPFEDFNMDTKTFETELRTVWASFMRTADFAGCAAFFDKALSIMEERQQKSGWGDNISNGSTLRSMKLGEIIQGSPANVFSFAMHLYHEDESGRLAHNGWHTSYGWGQWMRGRWEFWGGRASATDGMNGLVGEIARYLKPKHATLLSLAFHNLFTRLTPGDVALITLWAGNEKADGARAAILRELAIAGRLYQTACAEGRGRDGTCEIGRTPVIDLLMQHYRKAILNDQLNPRVRVALAHHLCNVCPFALPDDVVKKAAQLAAHENNELHCITGFQLAHIARRFVRLPVDDEWQRIAQEFWNGWARRQTFNQSPRERGRYYGLYYDPTFAMVQIAARARNERWLTQLLEKDATYLKRMRSTVALIATSGWETRAAEFLAKEAPNLHDWNSAVVKWEPSFAQHATALAKACKDPGLALIGELIIAEAQDFPMPFIRAFKQPSTFEERITALAPRIVKTSFKDENLRLYATTFVSNYAPRAAVQELSPLITKEAAKISLTDFAFMQDNGLRAEAAYALSIPILQKALAGDGKPFSRAFDDLAAITGDNLYYRNYSRNRLADTLADAISAHWQISVKPEAAFWNKLLMPIIDGSEQERDDYSGHFVSLLMPLLAVSGENALAEWRQSLSQSQLSTVVSALNQKDEIWRNAGRLCGDEALKTRRPLAARLQIARQLLASDFITSRYPSTLFTRIIDEGLLSPREIAAAAPALYVALAKKNRHALSLAEIAVDSGKADAAREVIDAALNDSPAPSVDHSFDLLELRLGIEVREKRKTAATEALTKLEAHPKASANRFTIPILKRLVAEMK